MDPMVVVLSHVMQTTRMENLIAFALGFVADIARSLFLPQTTDWLKRRLPSTRRKANFADNALRLEIMERLSTLGKDPNLIEAMGDEPEDFMRLLNSQQDAFAEYAVQRLDDSAHMTQAEMSGEAARRADIAHGMLVSALSELKQSDLDPMQLDDMAKSQRAWEEYSEAQAAFTAGHWRGGTGQPMIHFAELERLRLARVGQLRELIEEWKDV